MSLFRPHYQQHASSKTTWLFSEFHTFLVLFVFSIILWTHHEDVRKPRHLSTSTPSKTPMGKQRWKGSNTCLSRNGFALYNRKRQSGTSTTAVGPKWRGVSTHIAPFNCDRKTHRKKLSFWVLSFECFLPTPKKNKTTNWHTKKTSPKTCIESVWIGVCPCNDINQDLHHIHSNSNISMHIRMVRDIRKKTVIEMDSEYQRYSKGPKKESFFENIHIPTSIFEITWNYSPISILPYLVFVLSKGQVGHCFVCTSKRPQQLPVSLRSSNRFFWPPMTSKWM